MSCEAERSKFNNTPGGLSRSRLVATSRRRVLFCSASQLKFNLHPQTSAKPTQKPMDRYRLVLENQTANASTSVQISRSGRIKTVQFVLVSGITAAASGAIATLSQTSVSPGAFNATAEQLTRHIAQVGLMVSQSTGAAIAKSGENLWIPTDVPVAFGDYVYLYVNIQGTGTGGTWASVIFTVS